MTQGAHPTTSQRRPPQVGALHALRVSGLILLAALVAWPAASVRAQTQPRVPVEQTSTEQKAKFVETLVTRSVAARRIEESGDGAAIEKLGQARELVRRAQDDIAAGRLTQANEALDAALGLVNGEARRLSQAELKSEREQAEYVRRRHAVKTFLAAYDRVAQGKEMGPGAAAQMARIRDLMAQAEAQAKGGKLADASETMDTAYRVARGDIRDLRDGKILTRSLDFSTLEKEYTYEHDRNDSHVMLLQFAINEKNPPASRRTRIDQLLAEAMDLRTGAEGMAHTGDYAQAIQQIARSTDTLLKAIRMSGVWVPG